LKLFVTCQFFLNRDYTNTLSVVTFNTIIRKQGPSASGDKIIVAQFLLNFSHGTKIIQPIGGDMTPSL